MSKTTEIYAIEKTRKEGEYTTCQSFVYTAYTKNNVSVELDRLRAKETEESITYEMNRFILAD